MAGYIGTQPVPQATQHREAFTATASQTSFATVGYTPQFVDVYLNGVKLAAADYTATNGSDIVLTTGAALNDILEYVAYTPFEVADQTFTGTTTVTDSGAAPLVANRTTSDGDITVFQKDGTAVGSIGSTQSGANIYYAGGAAKSGVEYSNTAWRPWYDGARADNSIDLGTTANRFKDLYLSGGVYLGGIGAANYLDDYEEGTWTPDPQDGSGNSGSAGQAIGNYTKIGNVVHATVYLDAINTSGLTAGQDFRIYGLPFAAASLPQSQIFTGDARMNDVTFSGIPNLAILDSTDYIRIVETNSGAASDFVIVSEVASGSSDIYGSITYMTA